MHRSIAASLGFQLTEEKHAQLLTATQAQSRDGLAVAVRADSNIARAGHVRRSSISPGSTMTLCEAGTREYWRERILSVVPDAVKDLVAGAPEIS